jgi:hypothetical protein
MTHFEQLLRVSTQGTGVSLHMKGLDDINDNVDDKASFKVWHEIRLPVSRLAERNLSILVQLELNNS